MTIFHAPLPLDRAATALQTGWTKERTIQALLARMARDERYLAYRRKSGRQTTYDEQTESDLNALALAVCWLVDDTTGQHDDE
jgi:hypothetical protein